VSGRVLLLGLALAALDPGPAAAETARVWEVNGIRLEPAQVERLASDIASQTVRAVGRLEGLALREEQSDALEGAYREVALDTYDQVVAVVNRDDLSDAAKETEVKRLVIEGQERSSLRVGEILDGAQYATYRAWEERQVDAFRERGLWSSGRRTRRGRR
jgi:hypothetical protein